jgi:hypothetical protein
VGDRTPMLPRALSPCRVWVLTLLTLTSKLPHRFLDLRLGRILGDLEHDLFLSEATIAFSVMAGDRMTS